MDRSGQMTLFLEAPWEIWKKSKQNMYKRCCVALMVAISFVGATIAEQPNLSRKASNARNTK